MKIQEHPSIPDTKLQRTADADAPQDSFVGEGPRLDLTALCEEKRRAGRGAAWRLVQRRKRVCE